MTVSRQWRIGSNSDCGPLHARKHRRNRRRERTSGSYVLVIAGLGQPVEKVLAGITSIHRRHPEGRSPSGEAACSGKCVCLPFRIGGIVRNDRDHPDFTVHSPIRRHRGIERAGKSLRRILIALCTACGYRADRTPHPAAPIRRTGGDPRRSGVIGGATAGEIESGLKPAQSEKGRQIENDIPQPHVVAAFGLLITNRDPCRSSL